MDTGTSVAQTTGFWHTDFCKSSAVPPSLLQYFLRKGILVTFNSHRGTVLCKIFPWSPSATPRHRINPKTTEDLLDLAHLSILLSCPPPEARPASQCCHILTLWPTQRQVCPQVALLLTPSPDWDLCFKCHIHREASSETHYYSFLIVMSDGMSYISFRFGCLVWFCYSCFLSS